MGGEARSPLRDYNPVSKALGALPSPAISLTFNSSILSMTWLDPVPYIDMSDCYLVDKLNRVYPQSCAKTVTNFLPTGLKNAAKVSMLEWPTF